MGQGWPDCDREVREWLTAAVDDLGDELGEGLVGAYLHGSLAAGSFHPPKSDVDLLFVVRSPLGPDRRRAFARACARASRACPVVGGLECSVVLEEHTAAATHPMPYEVHVGPELVDAILSDETTYDGHLVDPDLAAHSQAVIERGVTLRGRDRLEVFGPVPREAFLDSVERDLDWILGGDHVLESPFYAVLNGCRMLWVWDGSSERLVPTKEEAALWAMDHALPPELRPVAREALEAYRDASEVSRDERSTAGRAWDAASLLRFRDHLRRVRRDRTADGATDPTAPGP